MRKNVYIDPRCLAMSLIPAALEEYHKEVSGYLIGSNGRNAGRLKVVSAYSLQSDIKKRTWVEHGNASAVKRVNKVLKTMNMHLVGGFHTHPLGPSRLSKSDIDFIRDKLEEHSLPSWLELIVSVKKKDYQTKHNPGWYLRHFPNKIGLTIKTSPWTGFDVFLSGYWIGKKGIKEATLWTSKRYSF
jgi:proteasome lid subunit RPN8/RPN11